MLAAWLLQDLWPLYWSAAADSGRAVTLSCCRLQNSWILSGSSRLPVPSTSWRA